MYRYRYGQNAAGLTVLEMLIAVSLIVALLTAMASSLLSAKDLAVTDTVNIQAQNVAKITLDRIARELSKSGKSGSNKPQIYNASGSIAIKGPAIRFQRRIVNTSGNIDWSVPIQIKRFDSSDATFVDKIVFWQDNSPDSLVSPGNEDRYIIMAQNAIDLAFQETLNQIVITIKVQGKVPNRATTFVSELSTSVAVPEY